MSAASFYLGIIGLAAFVAAVAFVSHRLRQRLLPGWDGALARLAEAIIGLGLAIASSELLGLFGLLEWWTLLPVALVAAAFAWFRLAPPSSTAETGEDGEDSEFPAPPIPAWGKWAALIVTAIVVGVWASFTSYSLDYGITNFDSLWYHLPFSAAMAQSGSVTEFQRPETIFLNWFYPQNSELLHAIAMIFTGRDFVSVFINLGWMGLTLLAGWTIGRPYGRSHLTLLAVAVLLVAHALVAREPGSGKNDIVAIAMVMTSLAAVINLAAARDGGIGRIKPGWGLAIAGLAAGLAAGTKVTALAPVALITISVVVAATNGTRLRVLGTWLGVGLVGGGYWYLKNLIASGNPLPQVENFGPVNLPGPERLQVGRPDFTVFHYIGDGSVWSDWFLPGLHHGFGDLWPLLVAAAVTGALLTCWKGEGRLLRVLGAAAIFAMLAYLVTPLTAAGPEGSPTGFAINLRFLIPALTMGLVLLPLLPVFRKTWAQISLAAGLVLLVLADGRLDAITTQSGRKFGVAVAFVAVIVPAAIHVLRPRIAGWKLGRRLLVTGMIGIGLVVAAVLMPLQKHYFDSRYSDFEPENGMAAPYRLASDLSGNSIVLAGSTAGFKQYGFFGVDLDNHVSYAGEKVAGGGFRAIPDCVAFKAIVNARNPDYIVSSPYLNFNDPARPIDSPEGAWLGNDPGVRKIESSHGVTVWKSVGPLTPGLCSKLPGEYDFTPGLE